jgi:signal transduction histidine kinase
MGLRVQQQRVQLETERILAYRPSNEPASSFAMERGLLRGLAVLRWVSWIWIVGVALYSQSKHQFIHPVFAWTVIAAAGLVAVSATKAAVSDTGRALGKLLVFSDVAVAVALYTADGYAFAHTPKFHVFNPGQSLTASWPIVAVASAGIALGPLTGFGAGILMGAMRFVSALLNRLPMKEILKVSNVSSGLNTLTFAAVWGGVAGWVAMLLRRAEDEVATARARDEFARTMHDSVLQTLALVERRTRDSDPELADTARKTDRSLRTYLFGGAANDHTDLASTLRRVTDEAAVADGTIPVELSVLEGDVEPSPNILAAVAGAVAEALRNVSKHANAKRIVVFADAGEDDRLFVSVRDDGKGFDLNGMAVDRQGVRGSIIGRIKDVGGTVDIESELGRGTEVRIVIPLRPTGLLLEEKTT